MKRLKAGLRLQEAGEALQNKPQSYVGDQSITSCPQTDFSHISLSLSPVPPK